MLQRISSAINILWYILASIFKNSLIIRTFKIILIVLRGNINQSFLSEKKTTIFLPIMLIFFSVITAYVLPDTTQYVSCYYF
jgi:hypothetical protein